ncbi:hypothetical protein E3T24_07770 [Cryobacterium sp. TmT2-59]|uniref:hypothetical protein n=1 Tax=Cryobacterium sp. TmT2-59 TaxID=1259264 RepID=UPI00106C556B|nr:hypothetical protein [Cryobacterium sp. TmT2-59]TFC85804.1 hypothetical protein E3T24_07770 [Cryobacterium sp. TmT2-59]
MASKTLTFDIFGRDKTASKAIKGIGDAADSMGSKLGKMASAIGLAFAAKAVVDFGIDSVKAFAEAQTAQAKLADAFSRFPKLADTNIDKLGKLNSALAKKTRFDDDAASSGQAVLAQFGLTGAQLEKLTPLLQDYAAKTGKDLPTAAEGLGKALLGQGRSLKDIGVDFTDTGTLAGNFDSIVGSLSDKVGGFAEKEGASAAGQLEILKNRFGEIQEKIGESLMPALDDLATLVEEDIMPAVEDFSTWFVDDGLPALKDFSSFIRTDVVPVFESMNSTYWEKVQPALYDFGYQLGEQGLNVTTFGETNRTTFDKIRAAVDTVHPAVVRMQDGFITGVAVSMGTVLSIPGRISGVFATAGDLLHTAGVNIMAGLGRGIIAGIGSMKGGLNTAIGIINDAISGVNTVGAALSKATGGKLNIQVGKIPMLATGGTALTAGMALVGERGPELLHLPKGASVIPLDRVGTTSAGNSGGNIWHISSPADPLAVAHAVLRRQNALGAV